MCTLFQIQTLLPFKTLLYKCDDLLSSCLADFSALSDSTRYSSRESGINSPLNKELCGSATMFEFLFQPLLPDHLNFSVSGVCECRPSLSVKPLQQRSRY